jgi:hypothetical protein
MPILPGEPPAGRPLSAGDYVMSWWPEFTASASCVCAGLLVWGPLAAVAVVPLLRPAVEAVQLAGEARREAAAALDDDQLPAPPLVVFAERLDRPEIEQADR